MQYGMIPQTAWIWIADVTRQTKSARLSHKYEIPKHSAIRERILKRHANRKVEIKTVLSKTPKYISDTTDMWTSIAKRGYMVVTIHFIDEEWIM